MVIMNTKLIVFTVAFFSFFFFRLSFLSTVMEVFADRMIAYSTESQVAFCQACIRYM